MRAFITGAAGFIGFHLSRRLLAQGHEVLGLDSFSDYYDVALKRRRDALLRPYREFTLLEAELEDEEAWVPLAGDFCPEIIVHLAAQAGVRHSIEQPRSYIASNVVGTFNVLEFARHHRPRHLMMASTSSVYGANTELPFRERQRTAHPMSLYSASKSAGELISHSYAHLFDIPTTCFRFFTVYGPWGRPDMALFKFARAIIDGDPIDVYGEGRMQRDFTYVDDLVDSIIALTDCIPVAGTPVAEVDTVSPVAPHRVVNIAGGTQVELMDYIVALETALGKTARKKMLPMQPGDVTSTESDPSLLIALTGGAPATPVIDGVARFVEWFHEDQV